MAVKFAAWGNHQFVIPTTGAPASGYKLYTYVAGSSTLVTTYTTSAGSVAQTNPIILNSAGFPTTGQIWVTEGTSTKIVFTDASDVVIKTEDNIPGTNDTSVTADQWVAGPAPTYVSATSFTLVGDQTSTFHVGRRLKTTNSGGTIYSTITASTYTTLTTITIVNDSGTLDSGLSAVSYGLLTANNASLPWAKVASTGWTLTKSLAMSGASIFDANASIAAHATTMDPWSLGNYVTLTGAAVTFTALTAAPQAGAEVELYMNAAHVFTDGAVFEVDGDANWTAEAGDRVVLRAKSTTVFTVHPRKKTGAAVVGTTIATQADQETATSLLVAVPPGRQQYHPSAGKAWVTFDASSGTPTINANYNVTSITDNGVGDFTVNWTTAFSSANYPWSGSCRESAVNTGNLVCLKATTAQGTGSIRIVTPNTAGTPEDVAYINVIAFGDQ